MSKNPNYADPETLSPGWKRKRKRTIERIISASLKIIDKDGFRAFTIHSLAKELGYTVGALYRYFPSKDAVVGEIEKRFATELVQVYQETIPMALEYAQSSNAPAQSYHLVPLLVLPHIYGRLPQQRPSQIGLISQTMSTHKQVIDAMQNEQTKKAVQGILDIAQKYLENAVSEGLIRPNDNRYRSIMLWAYMHGPLMISNIHWMQPEAMAERLIRDSLHNALMGWGAPEEHITAAQKLVDECLSEQVVNSLFEKFKREEREAA